MMFWNRLPFRDRVDVFSAPKARHSFGSLGKRPRKKYAPKCSAESAIHSLFNSIIVTMPVESRFQRSFPNMI